MNLRRQRFFSAIAAFGLMAAPALAWSEEGPVRFLITNLGDETGTVGVDEVTQADAVADEQQPPALWLGIHLGEVPEILRKHLRLERGVLAQDVSPDSPAAKAGVESDDVLLELAGKEVAAPEDVVEVMRGLENGDEVEITVLRKGKELTIKAQPVPRPTAPAGEVGVDLVPPGTASGRAASQQEFLRHQHMALKALERALADREALGLVLPRPGIVAEAAPALPENVTIRIVRKGSDPAQVIVERDGKKWEVTEHSLDKLPEDLRLHAEALLGGHTPFKLNLAGPGIKDVIISRPLTAKLTAPKIAVATKDATRGDDKLDAVLKELKSLRKQLDEVQQSLKAR